MKIGVIHTEYGIQPKLENDNSFSHDSPTWKINRKSL